MSGSNWRAMARIFVGLLVFAASARYVEAQTPTNFQALPCHDSYLAIGESLTCSTKNGAVPNDSLVSAHLYQTWGDLGGMTLNVTLAVAARQTHMRGYGEDASAVYIKDYHRVTRQRALNWSAIRTQGSTSYMTFTADNESCIGFDHAGPMVSTGYEWLLRGFFCLPVGETASFETLKAFLGATRVGSPGLDRSALGTRVVPLPPKPA